MKLVVQGIEAIELTDPQGLCDPPVPQFQLPSPTRGIPALPPAVNPFRPQPGAPTPFGDPTIRPLTGDPIYTRHIDPNDPFNKTKWGVGGEAIQRAGEQVDPDKWQKNWQSKNNGAEGQEDGNGNSHETR